MKFSFKPSPNYRQPQSTQMIMLNLVMGLLVVYAVSLFYYFTNSNFGVAYGVRALLLMVVSVVSCVGVEIVWNLFTKKPLKEVMNSSFPVVTGIILALIIPINTSYYALAVSAVISIFFGKLLFGGFGNNIFNPAAIGRAIILTSFSSAIAVDMVTGATPVQTINAAGWIVKDAASVNSLLSHFGGLGNLFVGFYPGALGETSSLVILLVGIYLAVKKVIDWKVPVVYITTIFMLTLVAGWVNGVGIWYPLYHILTGGVMFGAVFMLTDPVTNPTSSAGRVIFAIGAAFITVLIRLFANYPEGVVFSIIIMNMLTPMIESFTDGQQLKVLSKNRLVVVILLVVSFATIGLASRTLEAKELPSLDAPAQEENVIETYFKGVDLTEVTFKDDSGLLKKVYQAGSEGYVYEVEVKGFAAPIKFAVAIDTSGKVVGYDVLEINDTAGIGTKVNEQEFKDSVVGINVGDKVDTISAATISSEAVIKGIEAAMEHFNSLKGASINVNYLNIRVIGGNV